MIPRYSRPEMAEIWTEESKFRSWLEVEIAVCEAWAELGVIPKEALEVIKKKARFEVARIEEIEAEVKHDVIAFLTNVAEYVGPEARYIHLGMTSSDVLDTAMALRMKRAMEMIIADVEELLEVIKQRALEHQDTVMIGRTHGIHAEPITFGLKLAIWYEEFRRHRRRLEAALETISYGKISGTERT